VFASLKDTLTLDSDNKLELMSTLAVTNFPVFWSIITSVDNGESIIVGTILPCPLHAATKFNLIGLNELDVDDDFNLNLITNNLSYELTGNPEFDDQVNVDLIIEFGLEALYV
jgi:hypothetical protein